MKLSVFTYSNKGGREKNEDTLGYSNEKGRGNFVLADGLGGYKNSETASKLAVDNILFAMKESKHLDAETLSEILQATNALILEKQKALDFKNMKTTAVALDINGNKAMWAHIGDSRLYYFTGNEIGAVTKDHSVSYKKYLSGDISYRDINADDDRSSLLGVLGNKDKCSPSISGEPITLRDGDAFLLCSDGFWEYVYNDEMLIDFLKSKTPKEWAEFMLLRHIDRAKPGHDNHSLIAIFVHAN
jgi:serine/threonine protein phosphatase PrpC